MQRTGAVTETCRLHPDRLIEYYCRDDQGLCCSVCIITNHRLCREVEHFPNLAEQFRDDQRYKQFIKTLNSLKTKAQSVISRTKVLQELRGKMNKAFDVFEMSLNDTINHDGLKKMQDISQKGQTVFDEVTETLSDVQCLERKNQLGRLFIEMVNFGNNRKEKLHTLLKEAEKDNIVRDYVFEPGSQVQEILDDTTCIGKLSIKASARPKLPSSTTKMALKESPGHPPVAQKAGTAEHKATGPENVTTGLKRGFRLRENEECQIIGSTLLTSKKLLLVDNKNKKVILLNLETLNVTDLKTSGAPSAITSIGSTRAAVTVNATNRSTIVFVKITDDQLNNDNRLKMSEKCTGILYSNTKLIVAFCSPKAKIVIIALDGTYERELNSVFIEPCHLALSVDGNAIYVADRGNDCVKKLSLIGENKYSDKELTGTEGLIVAKSGKVLVCGKSSGNIHLLTSDLQKIELLFEKIDSPESLSYCPDTNRLFVGTKSGILKMYEYAR